MKWLFIVLTVHTFIQTEQQYFLAIKKREVYPLLSLDQYIPCLPPQGKYYADPFLWKQNGKTYLFFEDYDYLKGVISCTPLSDEGIPSEPQVVLELPIHLSFPSLFQEKDQLYMVPETYSAREIRLYRCVSFPFQWEFQKTLVRGKKFSDPLLFLHNGYYWLFTSTEMDLLAIYYSQSLQEPFRPHPINKQRLRGRNAGAIFIEEGRLIRPTMNNSKGYGRSIILKEIVHLDPHIFREQEYARIEPTWAEDLEGTHTFSPGEDFIAYDGWITID